MCMRRLEALCRRGGRGPQLKRRETGSAMVILSVGMEDFFLDDAACAEQLVEKKLHSKVDPSRHVLVLVQGWQERQRLGQRRLGQWRQGQRQGLQREDRHGEEGVREESQLERPTLEVLPSPVRRPAWKPLCDGPPRGEGFAEDREFGSRPQRGLLRILFPSRGSPERGCCQRAGGPGAPAASLWRRGSPEWLEEARHCSLSGQAGRPGGEEVCGGLSVSERGQHRGGAIGERHGASREAVPPVLHARRRRDGW